MNLLDDESPVVQAALLEEFRRRGGTGLELLREISGGGNRILAAQARAFLEKLESPDAIEAFVRFIESLHYELETGCLLLGRTYDADCDTAEVCMSLDAIAARVRELTVQPVGPLEQCRILNRVLFHEYGFRGNSESFDDPRNSFLPQVMNRRRGIPITLCILYLLVAQRCDLQLEPVGMPGRFLVGFFSGSESFYVDAYERGTIRRREELYELLLENHITPRDDFFAPAPVSEVLCRCCRNLVHQYQARGEFERAETFQRFVRTFEEVRREHDVAS